MIEKNLFLLWFGNNKPSWVDYSYKAYKDINPDFNVELIHYTESEIDNSKDPDIIQLLNEIDSGEKYKTYPYFWNASRYYKSRYFKLVDLYRLVLINRYGGIYVDSDTFPCRPFDENLLRCKSFCSYSYWDCNRNFKHRDPDNFFIGSCKGMNCKTYNSFIVKVDIQDPFFDSNSEWILKREKFYNLELKNDDCNKKYYIEHFVNRGWKL